MAEFSKEEAKAVLIAMTKDGMTFDGEENFGKGALVFKKDSDEFRSAYLKIAAAFSGREVHSFESKGPGRDKKYYIADQDIAKRMCSYCEQPKRALV